MNIKNHGLFKSRKKILLSVSILLKYLVPRQDFRRNELGKRIFNGEVIHGLVNRRLGEWEMFSVSIITESIIKTNKRFGCSFHFENPNLFIRYAYCFTYLPNWKRAPPINV